jgi:serine/threonine protein kinase
MGPDGIQLGTLLGAGSFGRVYAGTWQGSPVAVKVITHSRADDTRISQELTLSVSFDHPNLVRALHYVKVDINPQAPDFSEGDSDVFLPAGAVGVFTLPEDWAVVQKTQQAAAAAAAKNAPAIDTETWIVMDLMDQGNLAVALRHGNIFIDDRTGALDMGRLLRRALDVASGLAYLHSRSVCHGDLKWENVLLKSERQDTDGVIAKIADFGLSRALAFGQSHLSTRRYGTVTHMPPELLVAGKLTPAADVYSFGIMLWELVSRSLPFEGLHHGEVIHRVVTEDLRPSPWPTASQTGLQLPIDYIPLAEACWARRAGDRPTMAIVLQRLLDMLTEVEGTQEV